MCDDNILKEMGENLSRRRLGTLAMGAGFFAALPRPSNAMDVVESKVEIKTPDGKCEAHFVHPTTGKHPAVLVWPDAFGLRPAFEQMGKRLAESGYAVLSINPYYRATRLPALPAGLNFSNPDDRAQIMKLMATNTPKTNVTDAKAFVGWLDSQSAVDTSRKIGTTGYCMGGPMVMRTAATVPDRIGAGGSFHGGGLVTDAANSPHTLVPKMKAHMLIAIAANDDEKQPEAKIVLREAFGKAGLSAEVEVYEGAQHGWCPPDAAVYHEAQAERAWSRLLATFKAGLV
jgi:carboxymethylenebutenolidase